MYKWKCTIIEDQTGDLSKEQVMWLSECSVGEGDVPSSMLGEYLSAPCTSSR